MCGVKRFIKAPKITCKLSLILCIMLNNYNEYPIAFLSATSVAILRNETKSLTYEAFQVQQQMMFL